jgi:hypothetical protein
MNRQVDQMDANNPTRTSIVKSAPATRFHRRAFIFGSLADMTPLIWDVCFAHESGHSPIHSIISSARASNCGGTVKPSALATF